MPLKIEKINMDPNHLHVPSVLGGYLALCCYGLILKIGKTKKIKKNKKKK